MQGATRRVIEIQPNSNAAVGQAVNAKLIQEDAKVAGEVAGCNVKSGLSDFGLLGFKMRSRSKGEFSFREVCQN